MQPLPLPFPRTIVICTERILPVSPSPGRICLFFSLSERLNFPLVRLSETWTKIPYAFLSCSTIVQKWPYWVIFCLYNKAYCYQCWATFLAAIHVHDSPYFHSVSLVIWPLTLMKRTHFSELSISRFSTYIRKAQGWTLHFRTPDPRSELNWILE